MKLRYLCIIGLLLYSPCILAQNSTRQLQPGDTVPDLQLPVIINYNTTSARLSDFKGKLLILDFWSINCASCIKGFPHLEELQKKFGNRILVLPVSFGSKKENVVKFFEKRKASGHQVNLPSAIFEDMDNELVKLFPVDGFPLGVWINTNGKVYAITQSVYVNEQNIKEALAGKKYNKPVKKIQAGFNKDKPYLINQNGGADTAFSYRSIITGYNDSVSSFGLLKQKTTDFTRLFTVNQSIVNLVKRTAYPEYLSDVQNKKLVLEVAYPALYLVPAYDTGYARNMMKTAWCYEVILPPSFDLSEAKQWMYDDLCRFFRIKSSIEKRKIKCLVLKRQPSRPIAPSGNDTSSNFTSEDQTYISLKNKPLYFLESFLNGKFPQLVIDETGYTENIDIDLAVSANTSLLTLNKFLLDYGLQLCEEERLVEMLVVKETNR